MSTIPTQAEAPAADGALLAPRSRLAQVARVLQREGVGALTVLLVIAAVAFVAVEAFGSASNLRNVLLGAAFPAVIALGATFVIISGGIDLSVGSTFALGGVLAAGAVAKGHGLGTALLLALVVCLAIGLVQGLLIARVGLAPFIVTLAGLLGVRGLVLLITDEGQTTFVAKAGTAFTHLGTGSVAGIGYPVLVAVVLLVVGYVVLERTPFGLTVYAVGGSPDAAGLMGLPVARTRVWLYVLSAGLAGLAGVLQAAYAQSGIPTAGDGFELQAIAAVVIGGTLLTGGAGSVVGTACGVLLLAVVQNVINLGAFGQIDSSAQNVVTGVFLVVVVVGQRLLARARAS